MIDIVRHGGISSLTKSSHQLCGLRIHDMWSRLQSSQGSLMRCSFFPIVPHKENHSGLFDWIACDALCSYHSALYLCKESVWEICEWRRMWACGHLGLGSNAFIYLDRHFWDLGLCHWFRVEFFCPSAWPSHFFDYSGGWWLTIIKIRSFK